MKHISISYILLVVIIIALSCFSAKGQDYRDVVFLKNGSVIKGFFKELYPTDSLRLSTIDGGIFICSMNDVERIAKERSSVYLIDISNQLKHDDSEWRHRGYRGVVEYDYSVNINNNKLTINGLSTIHGYQFNQYLFLGVGIGYQQITIKSEDFTFVVDQHNIPVFGDLRFYFVPRSITPFVDVRAGYTVSGMKGLYLNPAVGVDFSISPRCGLFLMLGYFEQKYDFEERNSRAKNLSFSIGCHF